jgi:fibronectin-binding autotransporter adhesin
MHTPRIIEISGSVDNRRPAHDRWKTIVTLAQASPGYLLRTLRDDVLVLCAVVLLGTVAAHAQDATWLAAPATGDWNTGTNWTGAAVPTGTATFDASSTTTVIFSSPSTSVGALLFNAAAPTYSFNLSGSSLAITGAGITNNSSNSPIFTVSSVALPLAVLSIHGTAANATIINNNLGETDFVGFTTAGTANITTNSGGVTAFEGQSTGGTATITTNNGGLTVFENTPPDGGGQARLITAAGGIVDISLVMLSGMTAGSIEGAGTYRLGSKTLTVGGNNLSTEVSGTIVDGGFSNATGGSLIKVGTGTLTLSGLNTYSGGTTVSGGMLSVAIDANLGASSGGITLAGGELLTTADGFSTARAIDVSPSLGLNILAATSGTTATYTGVLSDTGALVVGDGTNTGTIVFTGNNTYSGGTTINGVTLQIGNGGTIGTIVGTVTDNGHLAFNRSDVVTLPSNISGAGSLTQIGTGTLILTGANTYAGGTTITQGTLQIGNAGTIGSIVGDVVDNANLAFSHSDNITFSGLVSGTGTLTQIGPGTLTLTNLTNSYSGGTFALGGTLSVANDAELGLSTGGITLQGGELLTTTDGFTTARTVDVNPAGSPNTLAAAANTTATYTGPISDTGALTIGDATHTGTVVFTGTKSYSGGTIINFGTLQLGNVTTTGSIAGPVFNSGIFNLFNANTAALTTISNNPGATTNFFSSTTASTATIINNGGFTVFIGSSTAGNAAITNNNSGQTTFNTGSTAGNATITTNSGGSTSFHGNSTAGNATINTSGGLTQFFDTSTGGQARFITSVGGIFDISQLTSTGMTVGSIEGAGTYQLGSKMLTVGLNNLSTEVSGRIVDGGLGSGTGGALIKVGTGTLTLTGANTYSGGTIVDSGNLIVDNAQALGTGDLIVNGGVLSADPQTINVLRNYTQNAGGTLQLNIAGRAAGQFDVLNVSGNAALDGTLRLVNLGYQPQSGDKLRLVTTGGAVSGRFAQFQNPFTLAAGFNTIDLVYARQSVTLEFLTLNTPVVPVPPSPPVVVMTTDFSSFAFTPNQLAAASLLDAVQLDPRAVKLISFLNTEPFANLPNDFQKISPDGLTAFYEISFSNANIQKLTLEGRLDDLHNGSNGFSSNMKVNGATLNDQATDGKASKAVIEPIMQHTPENRWGVWVTGFGDFVNVDGDGNAQGYNFTTGGFSVGLDYRIIDQLAIGVFGDYSHTWTSLNPSGHIDVDSGRGGLYATWFSHGIYLNAAIYGGHNSYDSGRAGLGGLANGSTDGAEWSTFITGGYDFRFGPLTVGPIASLQYTDVGIDSFSEKGSLAPLDIHSGSAESLRSDVGFRAFYQWQIGKVVIEPSLKAAWEHEYKYSALPVTAGFAGIPGPSATFFGPSEGHDSAVVSAGVSVQLTPAISTYINYDGQVGRGNYDSNAVTGGVRISF